ncbi:carbohydrate porin [Thiocapsa sp.]|uniref:carbohydrate porin n=1 Tax=Thiocapsa sp. TaxID=2024551 RepID=UPI0035947B04
MKTTNTTLGLAALTVAMIAANAAMAEDGNVGDEVPLPPSSPSDASGGWLNGDYLTGDWGGKRTELAAKGFDFFAYYNAIVASNVGGGIRQGTALAGDLYMGMTVDLGKAAGLDGWTFNLSGIDRAGASIDEDVGSIYSVMQLVGGQTYFLYNLSLEKSWADGQYALKFGRITATDDFAGSPFYGYYLSNSFNGQIRAVLLDGVMTSYPFAVWGSRFQYAPTEDFRAKIGVYQLTERMFDPDLHGTDFTFRSSDGVSIMAQLEWDWRLGSKPGHFGLGLNNVYFDMPDFNSDDTTDTFIRYYAQLDQQVTQERAGSEQGLYLFGTLAYTNQQQPALVPFQSSFGAQYVGPFAGRNQDRLIFGTTFGKLSDDYAAEQVSLGNGDPDYEWVLELGYRIQLTKFAYIQPDIQYIVQPGGTGEIPDATVIGMQFGVSL